MIPLNPAQHILLALGIEPFILFRFGGKRATATKRGPGRSYAWGKGKRIEGDPKPGTRRIRRGADAIEDDARVTQRLSFAAAPVAPPLLAIDLY